MLAKAVVSTLGPRSRNVAINREYPGPRIVHDGVTVARSIALKDPFEDMGAALIFEAANNTNNLAGDGTTTATLLADKLIQEGIKMIDGGIVDGVITGTVNAMELREKLIVHADRVIDRIKAMTTKVEDAEAVKHVATVSAGDEKLGKLVAEAIDKVGRDGVVMVEEGGAFESHIEVQEGVEFDNGFLSAYFVTDPDRMVAEYKDGYVLLTDYRISDAMTLVPIIEKLTKAGGKPLLVIADDVVGPALHSLIATKVKGGAPLVAVMAPEYADRRKQMLEDLAIITGGTVVASGLGKRIEEITIADLGQFEHIHISQTHTQIRPKNVDAEELTDRVKSIKEQIKEEKDPYRKDRLLYRLGKLSQSVATIYAGGASKAESDEVKERLIDAVSATKAALSDGVVSGGGTALLRIADELELLGTTLNSPVEDLTLQLVIQALRSPFETIITNAAEDPKKIREIIKALPDGIKNPGYDVIKKIAGDMYQLGVLDPAKVTTLAVRHAFSVAAMFLTTEVLVADEKQEGVQNIKVVQ